MKKMQQGSGHHLFMYFKGALNQGVLLASMLYFAFFLPKYYGVKFNIWLLQQYGALTK